VFLRRLYEGAPFYKKKFDELSVVPEKIASLKDFAAAVPLFDKEGLRAMVVEFGGDILAVLDQIMPVSVDDLAIMATTTGTTGIPTPYPMSWHDMEDVWERPWSGSLAGGYPLERPHALLLRPLHGHRRYTQHDGYAQDRKHGHPGRAEVGTDRILLMQSLFRGTVYCGTPPWRITSWRSVRSRDGIPRISVSIPFSAAASRGGIPEVRNRLESAFGARIFDAGAGFGVSCDTKIPGNALDR